MISGRPSMRWLLAGSLLLYGATFVRGEQLAHEARVRTREADHARIVARCHAAQLTNQIDAMSVELDRVSMRVDLALGRLRRFSDELAAPMLDRDR